MGILGRSWISRQCRRATVDALSVHRSYPRPRRLRPPLRPAHPDAARAQALDIWRSIDLENVEENILPTRQRPRRIPRQAPDYRIQTVGLRRICVVFFDQMMLFRPNDASADGFRRMRPFCHCA